MTKVIFYDIFVGHELALKPISPLDEDDVEFRDNLYIHIQGGNKEIKEEKIGGRMII